MVNQSINQVIKCIRQELRQGGSFENL